MFPVDTVPLCLTLWGPPFTRLTCGPSKTAPTSQSPTGRPLWWQHTGVVKVGNPSLPPPSVITHQFDYQTQHCGHVLNFVHVKANVQNHGPDFFFGLFMSYNEQSRKYHGDLNFLSTSFEILHKICVDRLLFSCHLFPSSETCVSLLLS